MGTSRYVTLFLLLLVGLVLNAEETFRTFTTVGGQSFTARVLSYEGQTSTLKVKMKIYPVPYNQLQPTIRFISGKSLKKAKFRLVIQEN